MVRKRIEGWEVPPTRMNTEQNSSRKTGAAAEDLADFLMLAQRSCFLDISKDMNAGKISYAQLFLLGCLERVPSLNMSEIARKMGHSTAAATGLVDRLQRLGYVERSHAEEDRRKILVKITDKGSRLVKKMREGLASSLTKLLVAMDGAEEAAIPDGARNVLNSLNS